MQAAAIVVAAGRGTRMGGSVPKQFQLLAGRCVLEHTLLALTRHSDVAHLVVVLNPDDIPTFEARVSPPEDCAITLVAGGATRDASVRAGLDALGEAFYPAVLIHDAARPCLAPEVVGRVLQGLQSSEGAAPALTVTDALWRGEQGSVAGTQDRRALFRAQTPQGFHLDAIKAAHAAHPGGAADDVEVARAHGLDVRIVAGDEDNIKITLPGDLARAEAILMRQREAELDIRTGNGFDVHRFGPGKAVILCGISVPHDAALEGHSDADVGMHAVTDAIYGALAEGDIGQHFPPSDPQWKGAASEIFLRHAAELARKRGFAIANADCTLICERPRIGPHVPQMRAEMARLLGIEMERMSVKATTSERLGFTGREEGIAALASATLIRA